MTAIPSQPRLATRTAARPHARRSPHHRRDLLGHTTSTLLIAGEARRSVTPALPAAVVQSLLIDLDLLDPSAASGAYDRPTLDAVARFQARCGLHVDGIPTAETADRLLAANQP